MTFKNTNKNKNKKLVAGVVGVGKWGANHVKAYKTLGVQALVYDADGSRAAKVAAENGAGVRVAASEEEILRECDVASIVVPTDAHYSVVKRFLEAGKHVLVEKPLTLDSRQARELARLAEEKNVVLAVGHLFRFNPAAIKLKELLARGEAGEPSEAGELNYLSLRYIHSTKPPRRDCGVIFNFASHLFDVLDFILPEGARARKVFCVKKNFLSREREDCAFILVDYGTFMASLEASWLHPAKARDAWVVASKEKIYADLLEQTLDVHKLTITPNEVRNEGCERVAVEKREPLLEEVRHFLECVEKGEKGKECVNNARVGARIVRLCEIALEAAEKGQGVDVREEDLK